MDIFQKKVLEEKWVIEPGCITEKWFDKKMQYFNYYGRDMETLFAKIKVAHGRRIFGKNINMQKTLNMDDMNLGFKKYLLFSMDNTSRLLRLFTAFFRVIFSLYYPKLQVTCNITSPPIIQLQQTNIQIWPSFYFMINRL